MLILLLLFVACLASVVSILTGPSDGEEDCSECGPLRERCPKCGVSLDVHCCDYRR